MHKVLRIEAGDNLEEIAAEIFKTFPIPAVIKPQSGGGSVGVFVVTSYSSLLNALREIVNITNDIILEEYISGTEIVSGFVDGLRGQKNYILIPVEIVSESKRVANANSKIWSGHLDSGTRLGGKYEVKMVPHLADEHRSAISKIVTGIKNLFGIKHYGTVDFIVSPRRGLYLIEADTHPHLTEHAPLLTSLKYAGIRTSDFIKHVLDEVSVKD
jgi:D-alanine-D-alanine ligase